MVSQAALLGCADKANLAGLGNLLLELKLIGMVYELLNWQGLIG